MGLATLSQASDAYLRGFLRLLIVVAQYIYLQETLQSYLSLMLEQHVRRCKSGAYTLASDDQWQFVQFGNSVYLASGLSNLLKIHLGLLVPLPMYLAHQGLVSRYTRLCSDSA